MLKQIIRFLKRNSHRNSAFRSASLDKVSKSNNNPDANPNANTKTSTKLKHTPEAKAGLSSGSMAITDNFDQNLQNVKQLMQDNYDVNIREFAVGNKELRAFILNIEGISDTKIINENVLGALMHETRKAGFDDDWNLQKIRELVLTIDYIETVYTLGEVATAALEGYTILFLDGEATALKILTQAWEHRGVQAPNSENVLRGPHEGFTETLGVNLSQIRRRINNTALRLETTKIGTQTQTKVCLVYLKGIASDNVVAEVRKRLQAINIDAILSSGYIEEMISDEPLSVFPTVGNTEVPDKFCGKILEGRVGIVVDGSPIVLTIPYLFIEGLQSQEDYYSRFFLSTLMRMLRLIALHLTLFAPALYIGIVEFHPNIIPDKLLLTILQNRAGIPFPATIEALLMLVSWEVLREGSVRVPKQSGMSLTIVGTLIIGQVALTAQIAGPFLLITVAATGLLGFLYIPQIDSISVLRIPILLMASVFGLFGVWISYIFIVIHLAGLRSFGSPYMSPMMPFSWNGMKDFVIRAPWSKQKTRPEVIGWNNPIRQGEQDND